MCSCSIQICLLRFGATQIGYVMGDPANLQSERGGRKNLQHSRCRALGRTCSGLPDGPAPVSCPASMRWSEIFQEILFKV